MKPSWNKSEAGRLAEGDRTQLRPRPANCSPLDQCPQLSGAQAEQSFNHGRSASRVIWSSAGSKAVTMPPNSGANCVNKGSQANPASYAIGSENIAVRKMPDWATTLRLHAPAVIPATSGMAVAEAAGRGPVVLGRTMPTVSGDRFMRISGA